MVLKKEDNIEFIEINRDRIYLNTPLVKMLYYIFLELREIRNMLKVEGNKSSNLKKNT